MTGAGQGRLLPGGDTCHKAEADIFFMTLQGGNIKPETVREQLHSYPVLVCPLLAPVPGPDVN